LLAGFERTEPVSGCGLATPRDLLLQTGTNGDGLFSAQIERRVLAI